jgi:hypothetical protein
VLKNPCYIGQPGWNRHTSGGYTMWKDGRRQEKVPNTVPQDHDRVDWVLPKKPIFDPVVPVELWERVQAKLGSAPIKRRSPKSPRLWLSGLLICEKCGEPMCGKIVPKSNRAVYICSSYVKFDGKRKDSPCQINTIPHDLVEAKIREYLADTGQKIDEFVQGVRNPRAPKTMISALDSALDAWAGMYVRVRSEYTRQELQHVHPEAYDDHVAAVYEGIFAIEENRHRSRLDQLETEHNRLTDGWMDLPTEMSKQRAKVRLQELEVEISSLRGLLTNQAERYRRFSSEVEELAANWANARKAMDTETANRRKADALRRLIGQIRLTFKPTGRRRPASELTQWEFVPPSPRSGVRGNLHRPTGRWRILTVDRVAGALD